MIKSIKAVVVEVALIIILVIVVAFTMSSTIINEQEDRIEEYAAQVEQLNQDIEEIKTDYPKSSELDDFATEEFVLGMVRYYSENTFLAITELAKQYEDLENVEVTETLVTLGVINMMIFVYEEEFENEDPTEEDIAMYESLLAYRDQLRLELE